MSATVALIGVQIAVAVLTNKKLRRTVLGIVLGVIIIIIMPVAAVISLFNGDIEIDTDRLQTLVVENLSAEEKAKLQAVENTMYAIEDEMKAAGFTAEKAKEAQVLYVLALSDYAEQTDFVSKLAGCFAEDQTDEQLITAVNTAFGTTLNAEDFTKVMTAIRAKAINTSGFTKPDTKNAHDLVEWAKQAHAKKWGYVWGTYGDVLTEAVLNGKVSQYPDEVGGKEEYIRTHWLLSRATAGTTVKAAVSLTAQTICPISVRTPCTKMQRRKARSIRSPKRRGLRSGMRVTLGYISGTVRSSMPPTPTTALLSPMFQAVALRIGSRFRISSQPMENL